MNMHFAYPNATDGVFLGCGRYVVFALGQEPAEYEIADPFSAKVHEVLEAAAILAPEPVPSGYCVYETKDSDDPNLLYRGDSLHLAFLLALISRARFLRSYLCQTDLWCTGDITLRQPRQPVLEPVSQAGFDVKLAAFLGPDNPDRLFIVPFANMADQVTIRDFLSQREDVEIATLEWLLQRQPAAQKVIITVQGHELQALVDRLFDKPEPVMLWQGEPDVPEHWVERSTLMDALKQDWQTPGCCINALIGLGGEGKSALARKWLHDLLPAFGARLEGVIWWNFALQPSVDAFFEAVYLKLFHETAGERGAVSALAQQVMQMMRHGRYVLILDSLESVLTPAEHGCGAVRHPDLRRLLDVLSDPSGQSFCLLTSRCEIEGLVCRTHQVARLSQTEGRKLLQNMGVSDDEPTLNAIVEQWHGHALSLKLFAAHPAELSEKTAFSPAATMLEYYDRVLTEAQQAFLQCLSVLRRPADWRMLERVFRRPPLRRLSLAKSFAALEDREFDELLEQLRRYRLLNENTQHTAYAAHPLIRAHYREQLQRTPQARQRRLHHHLARGYERNSPTVTETLESLAFLIEAVHHACQAREYDTAYDLLWQRVNQYPRFVLSDVLGAWETYLACLLEFFVDGEPQVSDLKQQASLLHEVGFCLMTLGRLREVPPYYQRSIALHNEVDNWLGVSRGYQNLVELYMFFGKLNQAAEAADQALAFARRAVKTGQEYAPQQEIIALVDQATIAALRDESDRANILFEQAQTLQQKLQPGMRFLRQLEGVKQADFLRRTGDFERARQVAQANLVFCQQEALSDYVCQCHRLLGDLDAEEGQHERAGRHYDEALRIVRTLQRRDVLIEVLLARGIWQIERGARQAGFDALREALNYAVESGFRLYEADIRCALSRAFFSAATSADLAPSARREYQEHAAREHALARQICEETGYRGISRYMSWGKDSGPKPV
ncbi:Alr0304 protein [Candidatus Vecturithrix granuli]|uniref:Alr0304 protein n=1 Tax=Vecturithrix granuli TaxID=1499967 RepID=A0A081BXY6_VECG1|nr:Alr0304 protein [Candidatus Vecturithrix granuli]